MEKMKDGEKVRRLRKLLRPLISLMICSKFLSNKMKLGILAAQRFLPFPWSERPARLSVVHFSILFVYPKRSFFSFVSPINSSCFLFCCVTSFTVQLFVCPTRPLYLLFVRPTSFIRLYFCFLQYDERNCHKLNGSQDARTCSM